MVFLGGWNWWFLSGTDILTDLKTLPASWSLKNPAQVLIGWQSPMLEGRGLFYEKTLEDKETGEQKKEQ